MVFRATFKIFQSYLKKNQLYMPTDYIFLNIL